eukprot:jgi/Chlat1/1765/Chrsp134S02090
MAAAAAVAARVLESNAASTPCAGRRGARAGGGGCGGDGLSSWSGRRRRGRGRRGSSSAAAAAAAAMGLERGAAITSASGGASLSAVEAPSCMYIGPLHLADQAGLEALYTQARDTYYSGRPLIMDEMFDALEARLREYSSKLVKKYPRCSLQKFAVYSDAEADHSQMATLWGIWLALLAAGVAVSTECACTVFSMCRIPSASSGWRIGGHAATHASTAVDSLPQSSAIYPVFGLALGLPVAFAAVSSLQRLSSNSTVAMKGECPGCGEEVYAFIRADGSTRPRFKTECHCCERPLVFQAHLQQSLRHPRNMFAYGRIYLVSRSNDLAPSREA